MSLRLSVCVASRWLGVQAGTRLRASTTCAALPCNRRAAAAGGGHLTHAVSFEWLSPSCMLTPTSELCAAACCLMQYTGAIDFQCLCLLIYAVCCRLGLRCAYLCCRPSYSQAAQPFLATLRATTVWLQAQCRQSTIETEALIAQWPAGVAHEWATAVSRMTKVMARDAAHLLHSASISIPLGLGPWTPFAGIARTSLHVWTLVNAGSLPPQCAAEYGVREAVC